MWQEYFTLFLGVIFRFSITPSRMILQPRFSSPQKSKNMSNTCQLRNRPLMWNGKAMSRLETDWFIKNKYNLLCNVVGAGKFEAVYVHFKASAITAMINYFATELDALKVRIYFGTYGNEEDPSVPAGYGKLLCLIFAPTTTDNLDMNLYFHIGPGEDFDSSNSGLTRTVASGWVTNYQTSKLPVLNTTVDHSNAGDTKSLLFEMNKLLDLRDEISCQGATGVRAYFAAFTGTDPNYPKQMNIQFILTHKIGDNEVEFFLEDTDGWTGRPGVGDLNTGNPCPPASCGGFDGGGGGS